MRARVSQTMAADVLICQCQTADSLPELLYHTLILVVASSSFLLVPHATEHGAPLILNILHIESQFLQEHVGRSSR